MFGSAVINSISTLSQSSGDGLTLAAHGLKQGCLSLLHHEEARSAIASNVLESEALHEQLNRVPTLTLLD